MSAAELHITDVKLFIARLINTSNGSGACLGVAMAKEKAEDKRNQGKRKKKKYKGKEETRRKIKRQE